MNLTQSPTQADRNLRTHQRYPESGTNTHITENNNMQAQGSENSGILSAQSQHAVTSPLNQASREGSWWLLHGGSGPGETDHAELPCGSLSTIPALMLVVMPSHGGSARIVLRDPQLLVPEVWQYGNPLLVYLYQQGTVGRRLEDMAHWQHGQHVHMVRRMTITHVLQCPVESPGQILARPGSCSPPGGPPGNTCRYISWAFILDIYHSSHCLNGEASLACQHFAPVAWGQRKDIAGSSMAVDFMVQSPHLGHNRGQLAQWRCCHVGIFLSSVKLFICGTGGDCGSSHAGLLVTFRTRLYPHCNKEGGGVRENWMFFKGEGVGWLLVTPLGYLGPWFPSGLPKHFVLVHIAVLPRFSRASLVVRLSYTD